MRRGRKLRSKNIRACSAVGRPAASAWRQTCVRARYIGRVSLFERMVRSKGRQLVTEVAKAAAFICCPPAERAPVDGLKRRIGELQRFRWGLRDPAGNW